MAKLDTQEKSIKDLLSDRTAAFVIPEYQRPYAWESDKECLVLWEDLISFAFPDEGFSEGGDDYFLGPIVVYEDAKDGNRLEVIDGQQRLTTIMLLLRALYEKTSGQTNTASAEGYDSSELKKCLWIIKGSTGEVDTEHPKLESKVAKINYDCEEFDGFDDNDELQSILNSGDDGKSSNGKKPGRYRTNYRFFKNKINEYFDNKIEYLKDFRYRVLEHCFLLVVKANSQESALRIFSTLNDRGKPLADADIFKSQLYKHFKTKDGKESEENSIRRFVSDWKELEKACKAAINSNVSAATDELFRRYMYYVWVTKKKDGSKNIKDKALRKFYEPDNYALLTEETFINLKKLAGFWANVTSRELEFLHDADDETYRHINNQFCILSYAPNDLWTKIVSVYFMCRKDENDMLDPQQLSAFLDRITAFIWLQTVTDPGLHALRTPIYGAMFNIAKSEPVTFSAYAADEKQARGSFDKFKFKNTKVASAMLCWWLFHNGSDQSPLEGGKMQVEHILARKRAEKNDMKPAELIEKLGNKTLLEAGINIRASDYRFEDKKKYYLGKIPKKGGTRKPTQNQELLDLCQKEDFTEDDIKIRDKRILDAFFDFCEKQGVVK